MDLPRSQPFRSGDEKSTHDFLSLSCHSSLEQDPRPSHGGYLTTHNFLQPLERERKTQSEEDQGPELNVRSSPPMSGHNSVEQHFPGGGGIYSINRISFSPRAGKPDLTFFNAVTLTSNNKGNGDASNCSSYMADGFTLWDHSASRKRKAGKECVRGSDVVIEQSEAGQRPTDQPSKSSDNDSNNLGSAFSSQSALLRNQSFMAMLKSAKVVQAKEKVDGNFSGKSGNSSQKGELQVKVERQTHDQRASTPRSKHSATEQRRRCKINDRFQMLRELLPHGDQKRDKASFLLEVIAYIQFLQEKVDRYERSHHGWKHENANLPQRSNCNTPIEGSVDKYQGANDLTSPLLMLGVDLDDVKNVTSSNITTDPQNPAVLFKAVGRQVGTKGKPNETPVGHFRLRENPSYPSHEANEPSEALKEQGTMAEGAAVHVSSMHSQGLLNKLTQSLKSSGVDLSQASISVQLDIGKQVMGRGNSIETPHDMDICNSRATLHNGVQGYSAELDRVAAKLMSKA